jgi:hypothetical protein
MEGDKAWGDDPCAFSFFLSLPSAKPASLWKLPFYLVKQSFPAHFDVGLFVFVMADEGVE